MIFNVPGCKSALSSPGTVTRPFLILCVNWRWLPFVAAWVHPSSSGRRMIFPHGRRHGSRAPRRRTARVALQARAVADHGEVAAFGAGFAEPMPGIRSYFFFLCFAWAKSDPATDLTF